MFKIILAILCFSASCQALSLNLSVGPTNCMFTQPAWSPVPIGPPVPCGANVQIFDQFSGILGVSSTMVGGRGDSINFDAESSITVADQDSGYLNFYIIANAVASEEVVVTGGTGVGYWQESLQGDDSEGLQTVPPALQISGSGPLRRAGMSVHFRAAVSSISFGVDGHPYVQYAN